MDLSIDMSEPGVDEQRTAPAARACMMTQEDDRHDEIMAVNTDCIRRQDARQSYMTISTSRRGDKVPRASPRDGAIICDDVG